MRLFGCRELILSQKWAQVKLASQNGQREESWHLIWRPLAAIIRDN